MSPQSGSGRNARRCVAGQRWHWDGVDFEVLHPLDGGGKSEAFFGLLTFTLYAADASGSPAQLELVLLLRPGLTARSLAPLAEELLRGGYKAHDTVRVDVGDAGFTFAKV